MTAPTTPAEAGARSAPEAQAREQFRSGSLENAIFLSGDDAGDCAGAIAQCRNETIAAALTRALNNHAPLCAALRDLLDDPLNTAAQVRAAAVLAAAEGGDQ